MQLYGNSVDSVAGQQQALDNYFTNINQSNRSDVERAAAQQADYAFRARGLEDQDMVRAVDAQNRANEFAFNAGQQQSAAAKAEALRRYEFGVNKAANDREFGLREREFGLKEQAGKRAETAGPVFASAVKAAQDSQAQAQVELETAQADIGRVFSMAEQKGAYNAATKKWNETHPQVASYADYLRKANDRLKNAQSALKESAAAAQRARKMAEASGMAVREADVYNLNTGASYPFTVETAPATPAPVVAPATQPSTTAPAVSFRLENGQLVPVIR